jgi:hypothetical protein
MTNLAPGGKRGQPMPRQTMVQWFHINKVAEIGPIRFLWCHSYLHGEHMRRQRGVQIFIWPRSQVRRVQCLTIACVNRWCLGAAVIQYSLTGHGYAQYWWCRGRVLLLASAWFWSLLWWCVCTWCVLVTFQLMQLPDTPSLSTDMFSIDVQLIDRTRLNRFCSCTCCVFPTYQNNTISNDLYLFLWTDHCSNIIYFYSREELRGCKRQIQHCLIVLNWRGALKY